MKMNTLPIGTWVKYVYIADVGYHDDGPKRTVHREHVPERRGQVVGVRRRQIGTLSPGYSEDTFFGSEGFVQGSLTIEGIVPIYLIANNGNPHRLPDEVLIEDTELSSL